MNNSDNWNTDDYDINLKFDIFASNLASSWYEIENSLLYNRV